MSKETLRPALAKVAIVTSNIGTLLLPYLPLPLTLLAPVAGPIVAALVAIFAPSRRRTLARASAFGLIVSGVVVLVGLAIGSVSANATTIALAFMGCWLIAKYSPGAKAIAGGIVRVGERVGTQTTTLILAGSGLAALSFAVPVIHATLAGAMFGDAASGLPLLRLGAIGMHLELLLVLLDGLIGAAILYVACRNHALSRSAATFAAVAWLVAGARFSPLAMGLQPTFIVAAVLLIWPRMPSSLFVRAVVLGLIGLGVPHLLLPSVIIAFASDFANFGRAGETLRRNGIPIAVGVLAMLSPLHAWNGSAYIVGPAVDGILRANGGDGTLPFEWLYPSSTSALLGVIPMQFGSIQGHIGNLWLRDTSVGWVVLVLALASLLRGGGAAASQRLLLVAAVGLSVFAALPSHISLVPIADPALMISLLEPALGNGAMAGLAGALALIVAAALQLDALSRGESHRWARAFIVGLAMVAFIVEATPSAAAFWSPFESPLAVQLSAAAASCRVVSYVPGFSGDDPNQRADRLIGVLALGPDGASSVRPVSLRQFLAGRAGDCVVVSFQELGSYLNPPIRDAAILPPVFQVTSDSVLVDGPTYFQSGYRVTSLVGGVAIFRRNSAR